MTENQNSSVPGDDAAADPEVVDAHGLVAQLVDAGILREDRTRDDLRLTDAFREDWWTRVDRFREDERARSQLATVVGIDESELTLEPTAEEFVASHGDSELGEWPSRAAFVADLALQPTLAEWLPLWERIDPLSRGELLSRVRAFLETCPACDGELSVEGAADTEPGTVAVSCADCGDVLVSAEL